MINEIYFKVGNELFAYSKFIYGQITNQFVYDSYFKFGNMNQFSFYIV